MGCGYMEKCDKKAVNGNQKTNNSVEGSPKVFQLGVSYAHPAVSRFIQQIRTEQILTEKLSDLVQIR